MAQDESKIIREFLKQAGRKGGKARAKKYDKATLSKWAKKGGRPKGSGKKEK
jgi:general stress protein YciG